MITRFESVSIQLGAAVDERRFVFHCTRGCKRAFVRYAPNGSDDWKVAEGTCTPLPAEPDVRVCKVRISGLTLGETYSYCVGDEAGFDENLYPFTMPPAQSASRTFQMVADIHQRMHGFTSPEEKLPKERLLLWKELLDRMHTYCPTASFILSGGDNVCTNNMGVTDDLYFANRNEYKALFAPDRLRSIPFVSIIGNHDMPDGADNPDAGLMSYHFDLPNDDGVSGHYGPHSTGNFWYRFGDALLICICIPDDWEGIKSACAPEVHRTYIQKALAANPDAKWRILANHIPPYAYNGNPTRLAKIRDAFESVVAGVDFDVVLSGDAHAFSRSKHLKDGKVCENDIRVQADENGYQIASVTNPKGCVHINIPAAMDYSSVIPNPDCTDLMESFGYRKENAEHHKPAYKGMVYSSQMFTQVTVSEDALQIQVVRSDFLQAIDTYTIYKTK